MLVIKHNTDSASQLTAEISASMLTANDRVHGHIAPAHRFLGKRPYLRAERGKRRSGIGIKAMSESGSRTDGCSCEPTHERQPSLWQPHVGVVPAAAWASLVIARATVPASRQTVVRAGRNEAIAC